VVTYLAGVLELPEASGRVYEAGGPEVLQTRRCCAGSPPSRTARCCSCPCRCSPLAVLAVVALVTDVDTGTGRALIDSMTNEVIVRDQSIRDLIPIRPMSYNDAVRAALRERREAQQARS